MHTLIHADIFFFVTTIAVVVVGAALTVALIYAAKVLSDLRAITREVREETVLFRSDIASLRADVAREGFRIERFIKFLGVLGKRTPSRSNKERKQTKKS